MTINKIIKWQPQENLFPKYSLESMNDYYDEISILLSEESGNAITQKIKIVFLTQIYSYRIINTDTSELNLNNSQPINEWTFFEVLNSEYSKSMSKGSLDVIDAKDFVHYLLMCSNAIIDILVTSKKDNVEIFKV